MTYNNLIDYFKTFTDNHFMLKDFSHGNIEQADLEKYQEFPVLHSVLINATVEDKSKTWDFEIYIFDLPSDKLDKMEHQKEVISDCDQIANDLIHDIETINEILPYDMVVASSSIAPLLYADSNQVCGVVLNISINTPFIDSCNLPITGITPTPSGECANAVYQNSDGSYTLEILSGGTATAPDITVTDIDGQTREVPANKDITCAWSNIELQNSAGVPYQTLTEWDAEPALNDQTTAVRASDGQSLETVTQPVGASIEISDVLVTAPAFLQLLPARLKVKLLGATPTSAVINGDYIDVTVPAAVTPSGIAYKCTNPTGNYSVRTGDCVSRFLSGEYDRTMPTYPTHYAELDREATQADVRVTPATGTLSTDLVQPTMLVANNKFGNKFRYTDDIGNPSDATVGSNLWAHVDWNNHSWTGATAGIVVDNLYNIEMDVDYLLVGAKYSLSSAETHGQSWNDWIDDIVALGTHKGRTGWRPLDVPFAMSGAHAAKCEPDIVWADEFFNSQRTDNRCGMMTGEVSDTNQYLYVVDSNSADMLHNATIGSDLGFQSDITNVFIIRTATT